MHQEQVADAQRELGQPFLYRHALLLYRQHRRIVPLREPQIAECPAHETRPRRHEHLDQPATPGGQVEVVLIPFPRGPEPLPAREVDEALGGSLDVQDVARANVPVPCGAVISRSSRSMSSTVTP